MLYTLQNYCAKFQGWKPLFLGSSNSPKNSSPPFEVKKFFGSEWGNIYIKRCEMKKLSQEKKPFHKIFNTAWFMAKKLAKISILPDMVFFVSFLAINQAVLKILWNGFFSWLSFFISHLLMYILPHSEPKKFLTSKGGLEFFGEF